MIADVMASLLYFLGLGYLVQRGIDLLGSQDRQSMGIGSSPIAPSDLARALSTRIGLGMLAYTSAITAVLPLRLGFWVGAMGAGLGLLLAARRLRRRPLVCQVSPLALAWLGLALALIFTLSMMLPMDVLWANDARSVWFFHAKIIYFANGLRADSGWSEPAIRFSHPYYPKLVPILAATEMLRFGYWNEYLPKLALASPLACYVLALFAGTRGRASASALGVTVVALLATGALLHDGYVDAYTALPAAGALWALLRWLSGGHRRDAEHALVLVGLAMSTKEEGRLFALALGVGLSPFFLVRRVRSAAWRFLWSRASLPIFALALAPALLWSMRAGGFGVHNYLELNLSTKIRALHRLRTGALASIMRALIDPASHWFDAATSAVSGLAAVAGVAKLLGILLSRRLRLVTLVCISTGLVYFAELCAVYLMTPYDFGWQLGSSADRVMLVAFMCLLGVLADALEDIEDLRLPRRRGSA